nr:hypothetical protein [Chromobacterium sp. ASV5]
MPRLPALLLSCALASASLACQAETLVLLRHGEKPAGGYGQLNCQGLNRALALSAALPKKFGKPDFLFAPLPGLKRDPAGDFNYIRPLATIEPTAIALGMPVDTRYAFADIQGLQQELLQARYRDKLIFIAWEHKEAEKLARALMREYGDNGEVPKWSGKDFDSLYVIRLDFDGKRPRAAFRLERQGLDGQSAQCPQPARP